MTNIILKLLVVSILLLVLNSCQDNATLEKKILENGKNSILFSHRINPTTGELLGVTNTFTCMKNGRVHGIIDLNKIEKGNTKELMLHFDWINPEGNSFYQKRETISGDSTRISSSISINPKDRMPGYYKLRLFLYRKLIAEKSFELLPEFKLKDSTSLPESIDFYTKINKKTTKHKPTDSVFNLTKKKWFTAATTLSNMSEYGDRDLLFRMEWYENDSIPFYKKRVSISSKDTIRFISSAISIAPENREVGTGRVDLFLFDKLIARKNFSLLPPIDVSLIKSKISLCSKVSKKTGKRSGFGTRFPLKKKAKVYACFDLDNCLAFGEHEQNYTIKWVNSEGKTFYTKRFDFVPSKNKKSLKSAISISSKKREIGTYKVQLYLYNELLNEKVFKLIPALNPKLVKTKITLYTKTDKTTGELKGIGTKFIRKKKRKVRASIKVTNALALGNKALKFKVEWVAPDGKTFYSKEIIEQAKTSNLILKSAVSINPNKREKGLYKLRVYLLGELLNEQKFVLD